MRDDFQYFTPQVVWESQVWQLVRMDRFADLNPVVVPDFVPEEWMEEVDERG